MELPLFPLNTVLFPGSNLPLHIFEERYKQMIGRCIADRTPFGVVLIRQGREVGPAAEPFEMGTSAHIRNVQQLEEGRLNITCIGGQRFRIAEITQRAPHLAAEVEHVELPHESGELLTDLTQAAGDLFAEYVRLNLAMTNQWARSIETPTEPNALADYIAGRIAADPATKQRLLEQLSATMRLQGVIELLSRGIHQLRTRTVAARAARWEGFSVQN
jgi:Lon protease-like protein